MNDQLLAKHFKQPEGIAGQQVGILMNHLNRQMNLNAFEQLQLSKGDRLLELGFGNGAFVEELFKRNSQIHYTGVELSEKMIQEASTINSELLVQGKVHLEQSGSNNLPFEDQVFTKVLAVNLIYFWDTPEDDLSEIYRVLMPSGKLYISMRSKELMQRDPVSGYYFELYEEDEVKQMLSKSGFKNIASTTYLQNEGQQVDSICIEATKP